MEAWSSVNEGRGGQGGRESDGGGERWRWRARLALCSLIGPRVSEWGQVEGRAADPHLPNCVIYQRLRGISSTWWFVTANKQFPEHTDNNMFVTLSPVSHGGNWSSCQKTKGQTPKGKDCFLLRTGQSCMKRVYWLKVRKASMHRDQFDC